MIHNQSSHHSNNTFFLFTLLSLTPSFLGAMTHAPQTPPIAPNTRYHGTTVKRMNDVFQDAPIMAKKILQHLNKPISTSYQYAFFVGGPGTGKTTTAKAIAFKADWELILLDPGTIIKKDRNATAENLLNLLNDAVKKNVEVIVVIDELNQMLENFNSEHHDTDATSKTLWTFLDNQKGNPKFFLIGTMNRVDKLPPQIKSRIRARCIEFLPPQTTEKRKQIFTSMLTDENIIITPECNTYIDENMSLLEGCAGRDFEEFALAVKLLASPDNGSDQPIVVTPTHFTEAAIFIKNSDKLMKYDHIEETEEERQERYHKASLDKQDQLFVQQQIIHLEIMKNSYTDSQSKYNNEHIEVNRSNQKLVANGETEIFSHFSPEQWKHYHQIKLHKQQNDANAANLAQKNNSQPKKNNSGCIII